MHYVFEVETDIFKGVAPRPNGVNELIGGDEMAAWVNARLRERGYDCSDFWADDHGWDFQVKHDGRTYLVVSSCDFEQLAEPPTWHAVQLSFRRSLLDRLAGRNRAPEPDLLLADLRNVLNAEPRFNVIAEAKV